MSKYIELGIQDELKNGDICTYRSGETFIVYFSAGSTLGLKNKHREIKSGSYIVSAMREIIPDPVRPAGRVLGYNEKTELGDIVFHTDGHTWVIMGLAGETVRFVIETHIKEPNHALDDKGRGLSNFDCIIRQEVA